MNGRGKIAVAALIVLMVFLLATLVSESEKRRTADRNRDKALAELSNSYDKVSEKVAEYLIKIDEAAAAAKEAGQAVTATREQLLDNLRDTLPQEVIDKAIELANKKMQQGKPGPAGPAGATGPAGKAAENPSTTTSSSTTTSTATTTTTRPPQTTTTTQPAPKPCTVGVNVPGLAKVCI